MPPEPSSRPVRTRFAPSPTGLLHIGNVRTALFSALFARAGGGSFVLRIEDTDRARSSAAHARALMEDLEWLGLAWDEGPASDAPANDYYQSQRGAIYEHHLERLRAADRVYPCFCTEGELKLERKRQRAAGEPPRYSGRCARLAPQASWRRLEQGEAATLRFRVPRGSSVVFDDLVRGSQSFPTEEIGDFILRRTDGTPAFFFGNAVDDGEMRISHVLRGEDHLSNTPRQLLLLEALELPAPCYGHISMIVGEDGAPLSKRHGSATVADLRGEGFLPAALLAYLARLGHHYEDEGSFEFAELARGFSAERLGRAPARFDRAQLLHWQRVAVDRLGAEDFIAWGFAAEPESAPGAAREAFVDAARPNVLLPRDARHWAGILFAERLTLSAEARQALAEAEPRLLVTAARLAADGVTDYEGLSAALRRETGVKGRALFRPLRAALTGELGGPELAKVLALMPPERVAARLRAAAALRGG